MDIEISFHVVECVRGNFGPDCEWTCDSCQNGASCSAENPACLCLPGWQGFLCNQTCQAVTRLSPWLNWLLFSGVFTKCWFSYNLWYFITLVGEIRHNFSTQNICNMNIDERIIKMNKYKTNFELWYYLFLAQIFNFFSPHAAKN